MTKYLTALLLLMATISVAQPQHVLMNTLSWANLFVPSCGAEEGCAPSCERDEVNGSSLVYAPVFEAVSVDSCQDDTKIIIPDTVSLVFAGEPYIYLDLDLLAVEITYTCGDFWYEIGDGLQGDIVFSYQVGSTISRKLELTFSDGTVVDREIAIVVSGQKPEPIPFFIEESSFEAGELVELDIWTVDIERLIALQFRLNVQDASIVDLIKGEPFDEVPFNILNNDETINLLWTPSDVQAIDIAGDVTWFTLVVVPSIAGSTADIFTTTIDPWSALGIDDDNLILEYEPEFIFTIAPRDVLAHTITVPSTSTMDLRSTIVQDELIIDLEGDAATIIKIYGVSGQCMYSGQQRRIDVTGLQSGMYFVSAFMGDEVITQKFIKK